jgi:superoxide reductase
MAGFKDLFQSADWKQEKHVPVIEAPKKAKKGEFFEVKVTIGKEIARLGSKVLWITRTGSDHTE